MIELKQNKIWSDSLSSALGLDNPWDELEKPLRKFICFGEGGDDGGAGDGDSETDVEFGEPISGVTSAEAIGATTGVEAVGGFGGPPHAGPDPISLLPAPPIAALPAPPIAAILAMENIPLMMAQEQPPTVPTFTAADLANFGKTFETPPPPTYAQEKTDIQQMDNVPTGLGYGLDNWGGMEVLGLHHTSAPPAAELYGAPEYDNLGFGFDAGEFGKDMIGVVGNLAFPGLGTMAEWGTRAITDTEPAPPSRDPADLAVSTEHYNRGTPEYTTNMAVPLSPSPVSFDTEDTVGIDRRVIKMASGGGLQSLLVGQPMEAQRGGLVSAFAMGGMPSPYFEGRVVGPGDGMSDSIPFSIEGQQPAILSRDEYVLPADIVSMMGNGSSDAGAGKIDSFINDFRMQKYGRGEQPPETNKGLSSIA